MPELDRVQNLTFPDFFDKKNPWKLKAVIFFICCDGARRRIKIIEEMNHVYHPHTANIFIFTALIGLLLLKLKTLLQMGGVF